MFFLSGCDVSPEQPAQCGSRLRPHDDPSCPCVDYVVVVPRPGGGSVSCRSDQRAEVIPAVSVSASNPVLFCVCWEE